jgi:hypothetical protein
MIMEIFLLSQHLRWDENQVLKQTENSNLVDLDKVIAETNS